MGKSKPGVKDGLALRLGLRDELGERLRLWLGLPLRLGPLLWLWLWLTDGLGDVRTLALGLKLALVLADGLALRLGLRGRLRDGLREGLWLGPLLWLVLAERLRDTRRAVQQQVVVRKVHNCPSYGTGWYAPSPTIASWPKCRGINFWRHRQQVLNSQKD